MKKVLTLLLLLIVACGPTEEEIQAQIDEAVEAAVDEVLDKDTTTSSTTTTTSLTTTTTSSTTTTTSSTTTTTSSTTTTTSSTTTTTSSTTTTIPKIYGPGEFNEETKAWIPDPNFEPVNLYNQSGKVVTVNSQNEMDSYISQGWSESSISTSTTTTLAPSNCPEQNNSSYTLPKLCSFSLSVPSSPKAGDTITFNYQVSAGSASFNFMSICLKNKTLQKDQCISISRPSLTGPYYYAIPTDWPDGEYGIERVFLNDSSGGNVEYYKNGQAYKNPQNALGGATSHQLFNANTLFTIGSTNVTYTLPTLTSFSLSVPSSPKAGDTITFNYQVSAGSASFNFMSICLKNKTLQKDQCISISRPSLTGPYYYAIPTDWPDGEYGIERVFLNDSSGGNVEYYKNGQAYKNPQNALGGATSHQLFNANTLFTIGSTNVTYTLPTLTSFSLSVPSSPKAGDTITFNYQVSAGSASFNFMSICLKNKTLQKDQCISISRPSLTGPYYYAIPTDWPDGEYGIERVFLNDSSGGNVEYYKNGQAYKNPQNALGGATSHQLFNANTLFTK
jgi:hypothetical protein